MSGREASDAGTGEKVERNGRQLVDCAIRLGVWPFEEIG